MSMEPGQEMDARVATEVMGKDVCRCVTPTMAFGYSEYCFACRKSVADPYSEDIAAAWEVVEKMLSEHNFHLDALGFDGEEWRVCIHRERDGENEGWHIGEAATAPHAICLAALKAMEEKP